MAADSTPQGTRRPVAFISHHSSQAETARHLKKVLDRRGIDAWMAPDDIEPGALFDQAIMDQVRRSDLILLLFCARSDQSRHVKRELILAEDNDKLIYPVRLENIDAAGLAYWLKDYQWVDWIDRRDETLDRMVASIRRQVPFDEVPDAGQAPTPPPPPPVPRATAGADAPARPPNLKLIAAIAGGLLLVALLITVALLPSGEEEGGNGRNSRDAGGRNASADRGGRGDAAVPAAYVIRPGMWQVEMIADSVQSQGVDDATANQVALLLGAGSASQQCVSEETARNPGVELFDPGRQGNCTMSDFAMSGGQIVAGLTCRWPALQGAVTTYRIYGTYRTDAIDADGDVLTEDQAGRQVRIAARYRSRFAGPC